MKKILTLNATVNDHGAAYALHEAMSTVALNHAHVIEASTVSMYDYDENFPEYDGDFHDDQTLFKVMRALQQAGKEQGREISAEDAQDIIRVLLNCGILFRERRPNVTKNEKCTDPECALCREGTHVTPDMDAFSVVLNQEPLQPLYKLPEELKRTPPMYNA